MPSIAPVSLPEIEAARTRLRDSVTRTPLIPLPDTGATRVWMKLENLQAIGSFKLRGAGNAMALADPSKLARGVVTASAGNMAQGVAWHARRLEIPCHVVVPDHAPRTKLDAIAGLGASVIPVPFERWWQVLEERSYPGLDGHFVHPVSDPSVIAGNGTIGLEILEDLPDVAAVVAPFGGGGLSCGIACALRVLAPSVPVYGAEVATAAPLRASLAANRPVRVRYQGSFVDGIGAAGLLAEMWPLVRDVLRGSIVSDLADVEAAVRRLVSDGKVVAEGAGATSVAAALSGRAGPGPVVCVVSGGNIDGAVLSRILSNEP